jgi:winged helix DNA-binding protein
MERVLSARELNRATLARQLLLERARSPVARAIERIAGMQAQWAPAPYVGLWSRLDGFRRETLERALLRGAVLRGVLMLGTVHVLSAPDYVLFGAALDVAPPAWVTPETQARVEPLVESLRRFAAEPRTRAEINDWLEQEHGLSIAGPNGLWYALRLQGRIVHSPGSSLWRGTQRPSFVAVDYQEVDPEAARAQLVRRYLAAFGPATRKDISKWSGLRVRDFAASLDGLRRFRDEQGGELYDVSRAPFPPGDSPAPARFLPKWDNTLLDRARLLPEEYRAAVVRSNADVEQTFLVDGLVAGTWRFRDGRLTTAPFAPLPRAAKRELEDEAARLEAWLR